MIEWIQVTIEFDSKSSDWIDWVSHLLFEYGALGTQVDHAEGYLENHDNRFGEILLAKPQEVFPTAVSGFFDHPIEEQAITDFFADQLPLAHSLHLSPLESEDWHENWKKYYHVQSISRFLKIVPIWETYQPPTPDEKIVFMDPGLAFGTGDHPTTRLGAQALEMVMQGGEKVIDVGTGSGILAFIAHHLGAEKVLALDLDSQAIDSAKTNLQLQKFDKPAEIIFAVNDLLQGIDFKADIIVANILPHILERMYQDAYRLLAEGGFLILGGILEEKAHQILKSLDKSKWEKVFVSYHLGWTGIILKKRG